MKKMKTVRIDCELIKREQRNYAAWKDNFTMKEAINKEEAITSIMEVLKKAPLWLNKCTGQLVALLISTTPRTRKSILKNCSWDLVREVFIEIKTQYYEFNDNYKIN